ncbi:MAG: hypothetical protein FJ202_01005 [Gemmatimonadetes bacterium]|nr:hypothetical protein [Gemmatimonadota bacterium]
MLINLLPDFLAVLQAADPERAYGHYFETHRPILEAYWNNFVVEPSGPQFEDIVRGVVRADRSDLRALLEQTNVVALARETAARCEVLFAVDAPIDVVLMVGVGAANAGELVVNGRAMAFVCLEHFTGVANASTHALGLDPELMPMWLAHEIAHGVRYTSPQSRSEMRAAVETSGGNYSYWETARQVSLREHLVNEGLAVHAARQFSPGHAPWEYYGYSRADYALIRDMEPQLIAAAADDLDRASLGLRLRFLLGGMSDLARTVRRVVLPERCGYFLGARMVESAIAERGLARALRAPADELSVAVVPASRSA